MENKIILIVATSQDGFIADKDGNGDFSSMEDKQQFRAFLHSNHCDCFVCGRKTAEEFKDRLTYKPLFILSTKSQKNIGNCIFIKNLSELYQQMKEQKLFRCALLGGAKTYHYFLENDAVDEMRVTKESVRFKSGIKLNFERHLSLFMQKEIQQLSLSTQLLIFQKKQKTR